MEPLISSPIPEAANVLALRALGGILKLELENQKTLANATEPGSVEEDINVYVERMLPVSTEEDLCINVHFDSFTTLGQTQKDGMTDTIYFVDVDTSAQATEQNPGAMLSVDKLHKFINQIIYILRTPYYRTLMLDGLVGGVYVQSAHILDPNRKEDSDFTAFCRIIVLVRLYEDTETWQGKDFLQQVTTISFAESEKGYKFVLNN